MCLKDFSRQDDVYKHMRKFHGVEAEKQEKAKKREEKQSSSAPRQHRCHVCDALFKQRKDLYKHLRNRHDSATATKVKEQHQATKKAAYEAKKNVEKVVKDRKQEEKPAAATPSQHRCHICPASFVQRFHLYRHMRVKHGAESATKIKNQYQTARKDAAKSKQDARKIQREKTKKEAKEKRQAIIQAKRQPKEFNFARDLNRGEVCIKFRFS